MKASRKRRLPAAPPLRAKDWPPILVEYSWAGG